MVGSDRKGRCRMLVMAAGFCAILAAVGGPVGERDALAAASGGVRSPLATSEVSHEHEGAPRERLLARIAAQHATPSELRAMCFPQGMTPAEQEAILAAYRAMNPSQVFSGQGVRFFPVSQAWEGEAQTRGNGGAQPAHLTYSFPADGIDWDGRTNDLNARLTSLFGNVDLGREYIRQAMASWRKHTGMRFSEVGDDNLPLSGNSARVATRGDIRIGGGIWPVPGFLAYQYYPSGGADMVVNTGYWTPSFLASPFGDYRYLRNMIAHEIGHGLGFQHTVPCNNEKCMEPFLSIMFETLQVDDIRGGQRNYGDRFAGQTLDTNPYDFGTLTNPSRSVFEPMLSTNGTFGAQGTNEDWFRFTMTTAQSLTISVTPRGGVYDNGLQQNECMGAVSSISAEQAGNLTLELRDGSGFTLLASAGLQPAGVTETLTFPVQPAGTYTVRVVDVGPNDQLNQLVQMYDLSIRVASGKAPPMAMAGVGKRIGAGQTCHFIGNMLSEAREPGATITAYDWDLDGDGTSFETSGPRPTFSYISNGVYPVRLRVTDSNGETAIDTINVSVFGATTSVSSISPSSGGAGNTIPIVINGTNLKSVTSTSQVTISGTGATIVGTPVSNAMGTQLTGLSVQMIAAAVTGPRNITVTPGSGSPATITGGFTITQLVLPPNDECSGATSWGSATGSLPFNISNATTSTGQSYSSTGCPSAGPINSDLWFRWTAPASGALTVSSDATLFPPRFAMYNSTACPPSSASLMACDDTRPFAVQVTAGTTYTLRVGSSSSATGAANMLLNLVANTGACCFPSGTCTQTTVSNCAALGGALQGELTSCTPPAGNVQFFSGASGVPVQIPDNNPAGVSSSISVQNSFVVGDVSLSMTISHTGVGDLIVRLTKGTTSATIMDRIGVINATSTGDASNLGGGAYTFIDSASTTIWAAAQSIGEANIAAGSYRPVGMNNTTVRLRNIFQGVQSNGQWTLSIVDANSSATGTLTSWTLTLDRAGADPCPDGEAACCFPTGVCQILTAEDCTSAGGTPQVAGTCSPNPCPQPSLGACCVASGSCSLETSANCASIGATWQGLSTTCSPNPCPQPSTGACCVGTSCSVQTQAACTLSGGTWLGASTTCSPDPCVPTTGACCVGGQGSPTSCSVATQSVCQTAGGSYRGNGSTCAAPGNPITCCPANFNSIAGVSTQDLFDFLSDWQSQASGGAIIIQSADFNGIGGVSTQDLFDYISAWQAGCQ
jgi:subtilisin-like proprotein convertase family protein